MDDFGVFGGDGPAGDDPRRANGHGNAAAAAHHPDREALAAMQLAPPVTHEEVRDRYRELVKRLHPDANGGDKQAEERLKLVTQAYATLKRSAQIR